MPDAQPRSVTKYPAGVVDDVYGDTGALAGGVVSTGIGRLTKAGSDGADADVGGASDSTATVDVVAEVGSSAVVGVEVVVTSSDVLGLVCTLVSLADVDGAAPALVGGAVVVVERSSGTRRSVVTTRMRCCTSTADDIVALAKTTATNSTSATMSNRLGRTRSAPPPGQMSCYGSIEGKYHR